MENALVSNQRSVVRSELGEYGILRPVGSSYIEREVEQASSVGCGDAQRNSALEYRDTAELPVSDDLAEQPLSKDKVSSGRTAARRGSSRRAVAAHHSIRASGCSSDRTARFVDRAPRSPIRTSW